MNLHVEADIEEGVHSLPQLFVGWVDDTAYNRFHCARCAIEEFVTKLIWRAFLDERILWKHNLIIRSREKIYVREKLEQLGDRHDKETIRASFTYASDGNGVQNCLSRDMKLIIAPARSVGSLIALLT